MKGNKMKDKITIAIISAFCIGIYWNSLTSSMDATNKSFIGKSSPSGGRVLNYIDFETPKTALIDKTEFLLEISDMKSCSLAYKETDAFKFSEAFGYYRQCLGADSSFQWKGMEYTTLLSNEMIIQIADSVNVDEKPEGADISQIR